MNSQKQVRRYTRARNRKRVLDLDLNAAPSCENENREGTSGLTRSMNSQAPLELDNRLPQPIDLEDDDVIISSPRTFAQAINNSIRSRKRPVVVDLESGNSNSLISIQIVSALDSSIDSSASITIKEILSLNKRRRVPANRTIINCDHYVSLKSKKTDVLPPVPRPSSPPKNLELTCPICMSKLVEETSTKCGHIFCKACIKTALASQGKCPTCRKKIKAGDTIRIYLPATRTAGA